MYALMRTDWNKNSFNASSWALASPGTVHPPLSAQLLPPIRTANLIRPVNMTQPVPGTYVTHIHTHTHTHTHTHRLILTTCA